MRPILSVLIASFVVLTPLAAQQVADTTFTPEVGAAAFPEGEGPSVLIDEAHFNFHTATGRYLPFARLLRRDGFRVAANAGPLSTDALAGVDVLVIANALPDDGPWVLPTESAFTPDEVAALEQWVFDGGSLLLIADHMPFPGAAEQVGAAFGLVFHNAYARSGAQTLGDVFRRSDGSLALDPITGGRDATERVDSVATFGGQAFRPLRPVRPLLTLDSRWRLLFTREASQYPPDTPTASAEGLLQGAALEHGRGRVAAFGEAAMFTAQSVIDADFVMGMNVPSASQNGQFALNVLHWLVGLIEPRR